MAPVGRANVVFFSLVCEPEYRVHSTHETSAGMQLAILPYAYSDENGVLSAQGDSGPSIVDPKGRIVGRRGRSASVADATHFFFLGTAVLSPVFRIRE